MKNFINYNHPGKNVPLNSFDNGGSAIFTKTFVSVIFSTLFLASMASAQSSESLTLHPTQSNVNGNAWNRSLGKYGESIVRNFEGVRDFGGVSGNTVFDLNVGEHGIDGLVRKVCPDGKVEFKVIEVKTLQNGTDFQLSDTKSGKQLSRPWISDRLNTAATQHPDPAIRKVAAEALEQFRLNPASVKAELHGISIGDNRHIVRAVDSINGTVKGELASQPLTKVLEKLSKRASSEEVRRRATQQLAEFDQLQMASKPRILKGKDFSREMAKLAGVEEKQLADAMREATEHIKAPCESRWVKAGGKVFKFVGRVAGPAGVVIGIILYTADSAAIEQRFERGEITREQADAEQAKLIAHTTTVAGGAFGGVMTGAAIGTLICPGPGTVLGGIVGGFVGAIATDLMMAATGLTDTLAEYLQPGVESIRNACTYLKEKSYHVKVAASEQLRQWVGPELFDETIAVLGTAVTWVHDTAWETAGLVKDATVTVKDAVVDISSKTYDAVADGVVWAWSNTKYGFKSTYSWLLLP